MCLKPVGLLSKGWGSPYSLSNAESSQSVSFAQDIQSILIDEVEKAKSQYPDFFTSIEDKAQMLALDVSEIVFQLLGALKLTLDKPLSIEFGVLDVGTNAFVEYDDEGNTRLVISLAFLENVAKETDKGNGYEANSQLRYLLAHEFFHLYSRIKYPTVMERSSQKTRNNRKDKSAYDLDLGERSAELFAIEHLREQGEENEDQKEANIKIAKQKAEELRKKLRLARFKQKVKSFFSK